MRTPSPESLLIKRVDWDFFLTFTHAPSNYSWQHLSTVENGISRYCSSYLQGQWWEQLPFDLQIKRLWRWQRRARKNVGVKPKSFLAAYRWEVGRGGHEHFHALIRILDRKKATRSAMHILRWTWADDLKFGHAHARRSTALGDDYITKIINEYEESRFDDLRQRQVFLNDASIRFLKRRANNAHEPANA